jgi:transcriptional regulator with XRE-family HTH domain
MTIGARIRQARLAAGISQSSLARLLGVTRSACSQWESARGTAPHRKRLEQLANLFGVSYEWLVTGKKPKEERTFTGVRENMVPAYRLALSADQEELLRHYNALSVRGRIALLEFLRSL